MLYNKRELDLDKTQSFQRKVEKEGNKTMKSLNIKGKDKINK